MKKVFIVLALTAFISGNAFSQIEIDSIGNEGVGTTTPTTKLDVNGVINATGGNSTEWKQQLTTSGDTIFISKGNYILLPGLSNLNRLIFPLLSVQQRLDTLETPISIFSSGIPGIPLDSLYGKTYQGGLIAYLNTTTGAGLIAAPTDQSTGIQWWNGSFIGTGAIGTAIGTGQSNTNTIIAAQGTGSYAATLCDGLTIGIYSDWFLPSRNELNKLYQNLHQNGFGFFSNNYYWSSTEKDLLNAWLQDFGLGVQFDLGKFDAYRVRAVRAF